jgi:hypothetical protein
MPDNARSRQIMPYSQFAFFTVGNDMVIKLCLIFVYRWLWMSERKAKQRTLSTHYKSFGLDWL